MTTMTSRRSNGPLSEIPLTHVTSMADLMAFWQWMGERHDGQVCFDTESGGLSPYRDRHRLTQIGDKRAGWAFGPQWFGAANEALLAYCRGGGRLGAFNLAYDWRVLAHQDGCVLPWVFLDDCQLVTHLANSAAPNALKSRTAIDIDPVALFGEQALKAAKRRGGWDWDTVPGDLPEYWGYGAMDPVDTSWLLDKHMPAVAARYAASYDLDLRYLRLCAAMMDAGMAIDIPYINDWSGRISAWHEQAMAWLSSEFGIVSPEAHVQVGEVLRRLGVDCLRFTDKTGQVKCDKDAMDAYAASAPQAIEFIRTVQGAKKAYKIVHSYLAKFLEMAVNGVVHYSIHSVGAQHTSRSSVTDPPMHTYDRDIPVLRGSFIPREGNAFVAIDADQIEMRLAAIFSRDPQLIEDFRRCDATGESFFVNLASSIYREAVGKKDPRYSRTKNTSYATVYGSGLNTAAVTAGVTRAELEPIYRGFKARYAVLDQRSRRLILKIEGSRDPKVRTISGRELVVDKRRAYAAVDYEIQGSAADIMKAGGVAMDAAGLGQFLRCSVHDEWWLECPRGEAADVLHAAEQILTDRTSFPLPITWSGGIMDGRLVKM